METLKKMTLRSEVKARVFPKIKQKYLASARLKASTETWISSETF